MTSDEVVILGCGGSGHEWSSACAKGNKLVAVAEERVSRKKYGLGSDLLKAESRRACFQELGISAKDVDCVIACSLVPKIFYHSFRNKVEIINHHLAHAYSTFVASGFKCSAILVADNSGSILSGEQRGEVREVETMSLYEADEDGVRLVKKISGQHYLKVEKASDYFQAGATTNSIGHFYRSGSLALGFGFSHSPSAEPISEDGKTMGLASYGDDRFIEALSGLITYYEDDRLFSIFIDEMEAVFHECLVDGSLEVRAAFARAIQHHTEQLLLHCVNFLYEKTGCENLCLAGGVALNSVANGIIQSQSQFKQVFVTPSPSDDGISLGCLYYGMSQYRKLSELPKLKNAYLGPNHLEPEVERALEKSPEYFYKSENYIQETAGFLAQGKLIAWFDGRSEFGPRALGHRSLLASPFPADMRDRLNTLKKREWFRPIAPMVLADRVDEYFDFSGDSPFMSFVASVKQADKIPAVTHVDGTARLQTVTSEAQPNIYSLIEEFDRITGVPVIINTSFNVAGEPIVETVEEAIDAAKRMSLDYLVVQNYIVDLKKVSAKVKGNEAPISITPL